MESTWIKNLVKVGDMSVRMKIMVKLRTHSTAEHEIDTQKENKDDRK